VLDGSLGVWRISFMINDVIIKKISGVILRLVDQNRYAQSRDPIEMIVQG
jgi:hypothetical protein